MLDRIFGCSHENITWPQTRERRTHVACLDCAKELQYDFNAMRIVQEVQKAPMVQHRAQVIEIGEFRRIAKLR